MAASQIGYLLIGIPLLVVSCVLCALGAGTMAAERKLRKQRRRDIAQAEAELAAALTPAVKQPPQLRLIKGGKQ